MNHTANHRERMAVFALSLILPVIVLSLIVGAVKGLAERVQHSLDVAVPQTSQTLLH